MARRTVSLVSSLCVLALASSLPAPARADAEEDLAVLRNTVINLLEAMTAKGLISKEAAAKLVSDAQAKATAEAAARNQADAPKPGDVRVTYVPETVRKQISAEVGAELEQKVTGDVVAAAREQGWGVPAALPEWVRNSRWSGDVRVRALGLMYEPAQFDSSGNFIGGNWDRFVDFQAVNKAGGIAKAGTAAYLNSTEDDGRASARLRFGGVFPLGSYASTGFRIATGSTDNPVSRDIQLGDSNRGATILLDQAWIRAGSLLDGDHHRVDAWLGKMPNPFQATELVWDPDVTFNGLAVQYGYRATGSPLGRGPFVTAGVFPLRSYELTHRDKWLYGAQLGYEQSTRGGLTGRLAAAFYDYRNVAGQRNAPDSNLLDYTAPDWVQKGNTVFDIRNDTDATTNLYALAADYRLLDFVGTLSYVVQPDVVIEMNADFVRNIGYDEATVLARTGTAVPARVNGYRAELRVGNPAVSQLWAWSAFGGYEYLQRDAVLDAFTDSDFHKGGTDAQGYFIGADLGLSRNLWTRLRYISTHEIDSLPFSINSILLDVNASF
jgi:hypothetical protein